MGADVGDIAKLRSQLEQQSKLAGKTLTSKEMDEQIAMLHFVGKTGVFRSKDIAKESESLLAAFTAGGIDYRTGMYRYAQFINLARSQKGSGAEARTSINSALQTIDKKRDKIKALGVQTENEDGSKRDAIDQMIDTITATGGDRSKLAKIFDPSRSGYAINPMVGAFSQAYNATKGSEAVRRAAGKKAINELLGRGMADSGLSMNGQALIDEMNVDAKRALDDPSMSVKRSIETVRQSIMQALLPALERLAKELPGLVEKFTAALNFVQAHPVGAVMALGTGLAMAGAVKGAAKHVLGGAARYAGDRLAQAQFGGAAGFLARGAGSMLGAASRAGATDVYVTGAAPGVMGGGPSLDPSTAGKGFGGWATSGLAPYVAAAAAGIAAGIIGAHVLKKIVPPKVTDNIFNGGRGSNATEEDMVKVKNLQKIRAAEKIGMENILDDASDKSLMNPVFRVLGVGTPMMPLYQAAEQHRIKMKKADIMQQGFHDAIGKGSATFDWSENQVNAARNILPIQGAVAPGIMGAILSAAVAGQVKSNRFGQQMYGARLVNTTPAPYGLNANDLPLSSSNWTENPQGATPQGAADLPAPYQREAATPWEDTSIKKFEKAVSDATSVIEEHTRAMRGNGTNQSAFRFMVTP